MNYLLVSQIAQIFFTVLLILLTLVQAKGQGLAGSFASSISFYRSRRGIEKGIFVFTIILGVLLVANSLLIVILS